MVELCGREVVKHDMEEHEDVQVSLAVENIGVDVREKTKRLSACCDRTPTDQDCEIPSRFNISHASRAEPCSLFEKQSNGSSGVGVVKAVYPNPINEKYNGDCHKEALALLVHDMPLKFEVHDLNSSKERNASMEDSLLEVIDNQVEAAICTKISVSNGPTDILDGIMSLSFHIQDDGTKQSGVHVECSHSSLSLTALDDSPEQPKLEVKSSPSLKNEVWVGYPGSSMDTTHPQDGDATLKMLDCDDIQNSYHYYHGPRDSRIISLTSLDETNEFSVASIRQMPRLEHCGRSYKASLVDYIAGNSSEHALWKDEMNVIDTCNEKGSELQMLRNPSSVYGRSQNVLKGLYNIPVDSFVEKSAADLTPLAVEVAPSAHLTNDITVCSSSDLISCCARQEREQPIHASLSQGAVAEFKHMSSMRNTRTRQSRKEVKNEMVVKRGRRSSKAVKYDECMKSFGVVSRKKRSYFTKPAGSYAWWSSGIVLRSPKNDIIAGDIKKESWIECGSNKSRKVGKRKETVSMVFHDKAGTTSTCVRLKVKSKAADQNGLTAAVPKIYDCSPPQTADSAIGWIKGCSGQVKGGCSMKYTNRHESNWPVQVDDAYLNSNQADTYPDALKLDADDSSKSLGDITDDVTGNAAKVYLSTSLQEEVKAVEENGRIIEDVTRNAAKVHLSTSLLDDVIAVEENVENRYLDPETSPDSEVIDIIPEVRLAGRAEDNLLNSVPLTSTCLSGIQGGITSINFTYSSRKKGRKKEMSTLGGDCSLNSSSGPIVSGESKQMGICTSLSKIKNIYVYDKSLPSLEISETYMFPKMSCSGLIDDDCDEPSQTLVSLEKNNDPESGVSPVLSATIVAGHITSQSLSSSCFVPDQKLDKAADNSLSIEMTKITSGSGVLDSGCKGINTLEHDPLQKKMVSEIMETGATDQLYLLGNHSAPEDGYISDKLGILDTAVPKAWACCDNCGKWRRIPSSLADYIKRTDCRWTCNDNMDRAFGDCSIPQEKSDQAINRELQLSDCDEDVNEVSDVQELKRRHSKAPGRERWTPIKTNSYLHRRRKNQTIDEIMVCHCKPPRDGGLGCGEECLNRMLNIECVRGTCPCGDHCSNQQFQERKYAKLKSFKSGKKGYGLCSEEDIGRGQFLIEYVGEVLDMPAYEARQKDYASKGHKHFYFMTLNGSEVIDACSKGNLGRFINHSCEPNCRTEKWMVNGEICIGLFAIRSIKKGEEVTFDYNYVRVFGAAAKKCDCGSSQCRGFIGGDPLNCEVVVHDSEEDDAEDLETVMIDRQADTIDRTEIISTTKNTNVDEIRDAAESSVRESVHIDAHGEIESSADLSTSSVSLSRQLENANETMHLTRAPFTQHVEDMLSKYSSSSGIETCMEEKVTNKASKSYKSESSSLTEGPGNSIYECIDANLKTYPDNVEVDQEPPRSLSTRKSAISSSSRKSTKSRFPKVMSKKISLIANKSKKFSDVSCRHEVVVEKLNELLDSGGGISKRKEAPKGYLKLLILTTASDNSGNGETIQSNRDLSMILDALLKTKSRVVLTDIINKNGLRMLHNIMKHYRRDFNRTPILRKLLKILEYLAENRTLNLDHINGGPPCPGMESFAESVLALTEHRDRQVHQTARSFRDRWIRRPHKKLSCKEAGRIDFPRGSSAQKFSASQSNHNDSPKDSKGQVKNMRISYAQVIGGQHDSCSGPSASSFSASGSTVRKRKSRWDQDKWIRRDGSSVRLKDSKGQYSPPCELLQQTKVEVTSSIYEVNGSDIIASAALPYKVEDAPPGFSAPCHNRVTLSTSSINDELGSHNVDRTPNPCEVVQGHPLRKFISRSPISYAIPISILNQDVTPQNGTVENWGISPSLPFHPFPPLPLTPPSFSSGSVTMKAPEGLPNCVPSNSPIHRTYRACADSTVVAGGCHINRQHSHKRTRDSSDDLGKTFFRQKKQMTPPWMRRRQAGCIPNNSRNMMFKGEVGNLSDGIRNYRSDDGSSRMECVRNNFRQDLEPQNYH